MTTLLDQWKQINYTFFEPNLKLNIVKVAGVYTQIFNQTLSAKGFWLDHWSSVLFREARIKLLSDRYLDQELWDKCIKRAKASPTSNSHTFHFNRKEGPKAGGCLLSIVIIRKGKNDYELMISSRAEEATMALLADIVFLHRCCRDISNELGIDLIADNIPIKWHMGVVYQNRTFVPGFIYDTQGRTGLKNWLRAKSDSEWEQVCIVHSRKMLRDDGVTGARKLWGRRMREWLK